MFFKVWSQIISTLKLYIKELNLMVLLSGVNEFLLFKNFFNRHCVIISKARVIMLSKLSILSLGLKASLVIK